MASTIKLPTDTNTHVGELPPESLSKVPGSKASVNSYLETLLDASRLVMTGDVLTGLDEDVENGIPYETGMLSTTGHIPSDVNGKAVTGRSARIRAQSRVGRGVPVPIMLPHSGFWITIMPPGESELLSLWTTMLNDKVQLGRFTYGAIFSATSIVTVQRMVDFVLAHVESTTVNLKDSGLTLKQLISINDVPFLLNGMGVAMYPRGIEYEAPCVADPSKCAHVTKGTIDPYSLAWYMSSRVPESVRSIIGSRLPNSVSVDNLKLYRETVMRPKKVVLLDETELPTDVYFEVPFIDTALRIGTLWLSEVHDAVISSLGIEQTPTQDDVWTERNLNIVKHAKASFLRQYGAFVTKVDMYEGGFVEGNEQDIAEVLTVMSGSDKLRADMITAVEGFIKESVVGMVGLPAHECPSCGKKPEITGNNIIALDPVRLFFKYLVVRVDQINQRSLL